MNIERMRDEHNDRTVIERVDPLVGSVLQGREGKYRIDFRLAAGGFGAIYRATHLKTGHQVALKVLHTELATSDARVIVRFRREGEMLMKLRDPHTITAIEFGEDPDGALFIVMELLRGESLYEQFRAKGPLPWQRMVAIALQVCSSLVEAHGLGIVHRDLKPANINLENRNGNTDYVKVLDFGIAKSLRESDIDTSELTQAGQMIGTFDYMAPEQMVGGQCTARTDIYTLGVMMYEMIGGRRPFADATSPTAMLASLLTLVASPLSAFADVPPELDRILAKCLEREPQNRYDDVQSLAAELEGLVMIDEGVTRMMKTPAPVLHDGVDELTMIDARQPRAKRDSGTPHPNVIPREASSPVIADHPRSRRDTPGTTPSPNVIRRDSAPAFGSIGPTIEPPPPTRARRDSSTPSPRVVRRDPSQPAVDPTRGSQPPFQREGSGPVAQLPRPAEVINPSDPRYFAPERPSPIPPEAYPQQPYQYQQPYYDVANTPHAYPQTPTPQPMPYSDARGSSPMLDASAWNQPRPPIQQQPTHQQTPRNSSMDVGGYDLGGNQNREVMVRRIVWAFAILLGVILAIVVATRV